MQSQSPYASPTVLNQPKAFMRSRFLAFYILLILLGACTSELRAPSERDQSQPNRSDVPASPAPLSEASGVAKIAADQSATETPNSSGDLASVAADPTLASAMIIRTGQASVQVDSLEPAVAQLQALALRVGGYVANSSLQAGDAQFRSATLELKLPAARFDEAVHGLQGLGRLESLNVTAEDVGEEFTDVTARVANAHRLEQRLIELLATRTGKLQDVLQVERELARVREEIERYEGRLRYLKTRVSVSTLSVTVHEKAPIVGGYEGSSVIGEAFKRAWRNFVGFVAGLIASLGTLVPVGLLLATGVVLLRWFWRRR